MSMSAQTPYNPDSNSDNLIGAEDLLGFLPLFGNEFYPADPIVIQTTDSAAYVIDTCLYNPAPYILYTTDSQCTLYSGDSIAQTVFDLSLYNEEIYGLCYIYSWWCYDSSWPYTLPVEIEESTDWVDLQFPLLSFSVNLVLPADSSFKKLYVGAGRPNYHLNFFSQGEFIGSADGGVGSETYMSRLVILVRDNKGKWYWNK